MKRRAAAISLVKQENNADDDDKEEDEEEEEENNQGEGGGALNKKQKWTHSSSSSSPSPSPSPAIFPHQSPQPPGGPSLATTITKKEETKEEEGKEENNNTTTKMEDDDDNGEGEEEEQLEQEFVGDLRSLSPSQLKVFLAVKKGYNVFYTGSAGTGKSHLLSQFIIPYLHKQKEIGPSKVAITASTGISAVNIGGMTIHSYFGLHSDMAKPGKWIPRRDYWKSVKCLIIDEISMLSKEFFTLITTQARLSGVDLSKIQFIVLGDFLQLPPIVNDETITHTDNPNVVADASAFSPPPPVKFAFEAEVWKTLFRGKNGIMVKLETCFRQQGDELFFEILEELRCGRCSKEHADIIQATSTNFVTRLNGLLPPPTPPPPPPLEKPAEEEEEEEDKKEDVSSLSLSPLPTLLSNRPITKLYAHRKNVRALNMAEMRKLPGTSYDYVYDMISAKDDTTPSPAPVSSSYSNGNSILPFLPLIPPTQQQQQQQQKTKKKENKFTKKEEETLFKKIEKILPIEKSVSFKIGALVMLVANVNVAKGLANGSTGIILDFVADENDLFWPLVEFVHPNGGTKFTEIIQNHTWKTRVQDGTVFTSGLPLVPAWSFTIHKSQGQTIDPVTIDAGGIFEDGQCYVAISRAKSLARVAVHNFDPDKVAANKKALKFYEKLVKNKGQDAAVHAELDREVNDILFPCSSPSPSLSHSFSSSATASSSS